MCYSEGQHGLTCFGQARRQRAGQTETLFSLRLQRGWAHRPRPALPRPPPSPRLSARRPGRSARLGQHSLPSPGGQASPLRPGGGVVPRAPHHGRSAAAAIPVIPVTRNPEDGASCPRRRCRRSRGGAAARPRDRHRPCAVGSAGSAPPPVKRLASSGSGPAGGRGARAVVRPPDVCGVLPAQVWPNPVPPVCSLTLDLHSAQ